VRSFESTKGATQQGNGNGDILHSVSAYAFKQAAITLHIAADWLPELAKAGINPVWGVKYSTVASKNTVVVTSVSNNNAAVTVTSNNGVTVNVTSVGSPVTKPEKNSNRTGL